LEGKGVQPEIEVPFPLPYARGVDPQKERAIEVALAAANTAKH
jgi:carboxyl-terminal processing protease